MAIYDSIDLAWSWDGDYAIDKNGDLADTIDDVLAPLLNDIQTIIKSETFDWQTDPSIGANLSDFQGEANTRELGEQLQKRVQRSLTEQGILSARDFSVRVVPTHPQEILITMAISPTATPNNGLEAGESIRVNFLYNTTEANIFFLPEDIVARNKER